MIKVVINKEKQIAVGELTDSHFIGVIYVSGNRGIIIKLDTNSYISVNKNSNNSYSSKTVHNSIALIVSNWDVEACYVFETAKELFSWVANG